MGQREVDLTCRLLSGHSAGWSTIAGMSNDNQHHTTGHLGRGALRVTIIGGGLHGSLTALLLADDGHHVTILERDPNPPPAEPARAWDDWDRAGVRQFRMLHVFLPRFARELDEHLPAVSAALADAGALRINVLVDAPEAVRGELQPDDQRFEMLTGRRPVIEGAIRKVVDAHPNITVRHGVAMIAVEIDDTGAAPHVRSIITSDGAMSADLFVDCSGRASQTPELLHAAAGITVPEELEDSGFVYYSRHFRSTDGSVPLNVGPLLQHYDSLSTLTLPADHGTWGVGIIASSKDKAARALRDPEVWTRAFSAYPLVAHWVDAEPITDMQVMAKLPDRRRRYVVAGTPVVTGLVPVGDAWACTNPSLGRGASIGLMHAVALRDHIRAADAREGVDFAVGWQALTDERVGPFYEDTLGYDRHRLAQIECQIAGSTYETEDQAWGFASALELVAAADGELFRAYLDVAGLLARGIGVAGRPGVLQKVIELAPSAERPPGPDRTSLETMLRLPART